MPVKDRIIKELLNGPKSFKQLKNKFKGNKKFFTAIDSLLNNGYLVEKNGLVYLNQDRYKSSKKSKENLLENDKNLLKAKIVKLTENYGFARVEDNKSDYFVAGKFMKGAVVGDEVYIKPIKSARNQEAEVIDFIKENDTITAIVQKTREGLFAQLKDSPTLSVPINTKQKLNDGDVIIITLKNRGKGHRSLIANIKTVIGVIDDSEKSVELLLAQKKVPVLFTTEEVNEAFSISNAMDINSQREYRRDLTNENIFTIDSEKTKDIDDAISIKRDENGFILGVHIADVSHFVKPNSLCDKSAFERGTSIYFGQSVIPMLPKDYSNNVCSLNPNVLRFSLSCDIYLDNNGDVLKYEFYKAIIKSKIKGVYSEINDVYAKTASSKIEEKYSFLSSEFKNLYELYLLLDKKRKARGSMGIESDEAYIIFNEDNIPVGIEKRARGLSEMMIEEFMLLANNCAARFSKDKEVPFLYRTHEEPSEEKLGILRDNLTRLNFRIEDKDKGLQLALSKLLDETKGTKFEKFVHMGVLRSQSKAKYTAESIGHFGLGLSDYSHFTSPIRRYPDLAIHRVISDYIKGYSKEKINKRYLKFTQKAAVQSSERELVAMQIERGADDIYKAQYMSSFIGDKFKGVITSVTNFGIYVSLDNTVEGLVHISKLDMINPVLEEGFKISCILTGESFAIGDEIEVYLAKTDVLNGNIDFVLELGDINKVGKDKANQKENLKRKSSFKKENKYKKEKTNSFKTNSSKPKEKKKPFYEDAKKKSKKRR